MTGTATGTPAKTVAQLLGAKDIVVACGPGGVGKTTTAAALAAMAVVEEGGRVLVLTVDPARRLADALGLKGIGNDEVRITDEVWTDAAATPRGELWAAMLDTKQSWDDLIRAHAPDPETREQILANPLYQNISGRFVQSHDYIAMERLYEIHTEGKYDLIVVDTPPTRNALDFLDAPQRMADFFSSRLLRWLIVPYRSRLVNVASRPFYQVADRILGTQFLADISEFFILFQSMYPGFVERAEAVTRLLSDRRTTFMVVSTLEATPVREAEFFSAELTKRKLHLGAIVLNKVLPPYLRDPKTDKLAQSMEARAAELSVGLTEDPAVAERVIGEVAQSFLNFGVVARREAEQQAELSGAPDVLVTVPFFDADIYDMSGLLRLGRSGLGLMEAAPGSAGTVPDPGRRAARTIGAMAQLINPEVLEYADAHTTAPPASLEAVDASTKEDFAAWGMMVGRQEGRFLEMLVFALQATSVLEIGTFTGYSAIAMAAGLAKGGAIISLEVDPHHAQVARGNIAAAGYESYISVIEGPALRSLEELQGPFDLVFIDADKVSYDAYYEAALPKLAPHGLIVVDNTLQSGGVLASEKNPHEGAKALRAFNDKVVNDPRVVCVLTTIRDGVTLIRRAPGR